MPGAADDGIADTRLLQLNGDMAQSANEKLPLVRVLGMATADEGVQRSDAVHETVFQKEVQRAVHRWRRRAPAILFAEHRQDVVGAQRFVALPYQLQHPAAQRRQAQPLTGAQGIGFSQGAVHAMGMVMRTVGQRRNGHGQRRFWMETLLCYLFLTIRVPTVARFLTLFVAFIAFSAHADVRVLTSIKPLQQIAAAVQEGVGSPEVLLPPGASPHHYALRPSDVRRVAEADLLYWIGPDMEGFLPRVLASRSKTTVAVQSLPGMKLRHFGEDSHSHDEDHDDHDHDHRPGSLDAHLWLSSVNARVIAGKMAADLASADPANADRYTRNLATFTQRLDALDARIKARVAGVAGKPYFVFHEAFDYFEAEYGLKHTGVFSVASEVQPGAQHVAAMRKRLQEVGKTCVFSEPPLRPRLAETLTAGLPVRLAELDALGGTDPVDAQGYERLLDKLGGDLASCLEQL